MSGEMTFPLIGVSAMANTRDNASTAALSAVKIVLSLVGF